MSILRDFQDDPETWAGHTGDLLKVKGKPSQNYSGLAYELDSDGEPDSIPKGEGKAIRVIDNRKE